MTDRDAMLAAVAASPADDTPRLVFADWLDEHGEEAYASFVRKQVELARLSPRIRVLASSYTKSLDPRENRLRVEGSGCIRSEYAHLFRWEADVQIDKGTVERGLRVLSCTTDNRLGNRYRTVNFEAGENYGEPDPESEQFVELWAETDTLLRRLGSLAAGLPEGISCSWIWRGAPHRVSATYGAWAKNAGEVLDRYPVQQLDLEGTLDTGEVLNAAAEIWPALSIGAVVLEPDHSSRAELGEVGSRAGWSRFWREVGPPRIRRIPPPTMRQ
jgi:uncharacterized protein (TIGR02996 family)